MRKLFTTIVAALLAATSFASVSYDLNGGVTNDYGWQSKSDMFSAFMTDAGATDFETLEYYMAQADPLGAPNICAKLLDVTPAFKMADKWGWLEAYIMQAHADQAADGASALTAGVNSGAWRYAVGAFFCSTQRASWPKSADFAQLGQDAVYIPSWKHAYANPTEPTDSVALNAPYKEGLTFAGWYANADFSGARVTYVDAKTTGTLYAKWIEYVPTIAEVVALADSTETKVSGVVNHIQGKNLYIQDATGGILVYTSADPTCKVGEKIIAKGMKVLYGGAPEIAKAEVTSAEAAELFEPVTFETIGALTAEPLKYFAQRVRVPGLKIVSYDSYKNPFVTDGTDTVQCYRMSLDETQFPVGSKVTIVAVAGYYNKFQFVGDIAGIEKVVVGKKDAYAYPARGENGEYTLENNWIISVNEDNFEANKPGPTDNVRGMAAKEDGKMYFINRATASITVVDAATGEMLEPIAIKGDHLFQTQNATTGEWSNAAVTLPYNDIRFDGAGNCLIGSLSTQGNTFFVYKVDLATGEATELIKERLYDNPNFTDNGYRFDAFGVYGDVNNNAIIMAADANSFNVYKWDITNGMAGKAEQITCTVDPRFDESLLIKDGALTVANFGYNPQIYPVSGDLFYVDGWSTLPMLFDMEGSLKEDFIHVPTGTTVTNNPGDVCNMNTGHNGVVEFQVGDEYFLLMAATNTVGSPASTFALYKFADEAKKFAGLEPMWYFPANGMGSLTNGCRVAVPAVEVKDSVATLYLYTNNNGYAVYTFKGKEVKEVKATIGIHPDSQDMGYVSGSGTYYHGDNITITATPYTDYHFVRWSDGSTDNPRIVHLTSDTTILALFAEGSHGGQCGDSLYWYYKGNTLHITGSGAMYDMVEYDSSTGYYNATAPWLELRESIYNIVLPEKLTYIGAGAFYGCAATDITIPNSVLSIGHNAFNRCSNLASVIIGNHVTSIDNYAFYGCIGITSITLPNSVEVTGHGLFHECTNLHKVVCENPDLVAYGGWFYNSVALDTVIAPATALEFGYEALPQNLKYVKLTNGELSGNAQWALTCSSRVIRTLDLSCATNTTIANELFKGCYQLDSLALPNALETIPYMAVAECMNLKSVSIPATTVYIAPRAFENCRLLSKVQFATNGQLAVIDNWAFYNCHELQSIAIPEGVTRVGYAAFYGCTYLKELSLPSSVETIDDNGFALCSKLRKITVTAVVPPVVEAKAFENVDRTIPVYVPLQSVPQYEAAEVWKEFNIQGVVTDATSVMVSDSVGSTKILRDGQVLILRNGKTYNVMGVEIQ